MTGENRVTEIQCKEMSFSYTRDIEVLHQISFTVESGKSVGLIGANGAGKSTILKLFVGLLSGYEGAISIQGMPVCKKNLTEIRKKTGYVFQDSDSQLFLSTVYEDVAFGPRNYGYDETTVEQRVMEALRKVHLEHLRDRQIYRMSGGQKKLASIATILSMEPELILLDEPSIALDPGNRRNLIRILNEMPETKIIASHDLDMILDTCEETILLAEGRVICQGNTQKILADRDLLEKYGMELPLCMQKSVR